jgi:hypothetical protein
MFSATKFQQDATKRSRALSIPKRISLPIIRKVVEWRRSSGEEWTVDRLKSIKLDVIRAKAGLPFCSSWIARNSRYHKGMFGTLEKWMSKSDKHFAKGLQMLQVYTTFFAPQVTENQKEKFISGVTAPLPELSIVEKACSLIDKGYDLYPEKLLVRKLDSPQPLVDMIPSPNRRAPLLDSSVPEEEGIIDSMQFLMGTTKGHEHYLKYKDHYRSVFGELWSSLCDPENRVNNKDVFGKFKVTDHFLVGRIGLIQEPGYKLRAVANPGRVFQRVLQPLGDRIYSFLRDLPFDCTFDQHKAFPVLQEALTHSKTVYSIDLSGATDYFPLSLQRHLLLKVFPKVDVDLFCDLSQATWYMPGFGNISWKRGQPLGLYPSFGAFALTHGCLLLGLLGKEWDNHFFILGDDVVILDPKLAQDYLALLAELGCPVSSSKTLTSSSLCEFGGKVLLPSIVISQYKWREISDDSFLDIAKILGPKSLPLFQVRQVKIIKRFSEIPDFLGGLGWNPKGKPLEDRCSDPLSWPDQLPVDHLMDYSAVRIRNLLNSKSYQRTIFTKPIGYQSMWFDKDRDLDQRSSLTVKQFLPGLVNLDKRILGRNIDALSLSLYGKHAELPINTLDGNTLRPSLLLVMEAKVRRKDR